MNRNLRNPSSKSEMRRRTIERWNKPEGGTVWKDTRMPEAKWDDVPAIFKAKQQPFVVYRIDKQVIGIYSTEQSTFNTNY